MNTEDNRHWNALLEKAKHDRNPAADLPALLRAAWQQAKAEPRGWGVDLATIFLPGRFMPAFLVSTGACAFFIVWQVLDLLEMLPWAQLLELSSGGAL
jgi:hypothetical protein